MPEYFACNTAYPTSIAEVWPYWVQTMQMTTTTNSVQTWDNWITFGTTDGTYVNNNTVAVWNNWYQQAPTGSSIPITTNSLYATPGHFNGIIESKMPELTPKQEWDIKQQRIVTRNRNRAYNMRKRVAARKAEALLLDNLDAEQREEWVVSKQFHIETADGRRRYRIKQGLAGNVYLVKEDDRETTDHYSYIYRYCCHISSLLPVDDNVLTQKLLIETNEEEFLRLANVS